MDAETLSIMKSLSTEDSKQDAVVHSLQVRKSLSSGNYGRFFKLYRVAPNMSGYMMDVFIEKHRILAL